MSLVFAVVLSLAACAPRKPVEPGPEPAGPAASAVSEQDRAAESRPQTPKGPVPYPTRELVVKAADGVTLTGTLALPAGEGPAPVVLLLTGSGAQDRDESIAGHRPFAVWSDHLARNGIGTLRLDDRGVGGSGGTLSATTASTLKLDAMAALDALGAEAGVDAARLAVMGHSEGGTIAGLVAAERPSLKGVVLLAAPGVSGREVLVGQASAILSAAGAPQAVIQEHAKAHGDALDALDDPLRVREAFRHLVLVQVDLAVEHLGAPRPADVEPLVDQAMTQVDTASFRSFMKQDPPATLATVTSPILAVGGSLDLQVLPRQNLDTLRRALDKHPDATVLEFPGLNHLFQHAGIGTPEEYGLIPETVAPEVLEAVTGWLRQRL